MVIDVFNCFETEILKLAIVINEMHTEKNIFSLKQLLETGYPELAHHSACTLLRCWWSDPSAQV